MLGEGLDGAQWCPPACRPPASGRPHAPDAIIRGGPSSPLSPPPGRDAEQRGLRGGAIPVLPWYPLSSLPDLRVLPGGPGLVMAG